MGRHIMSALESSDLPDQAQTSGATLGRETLHVRAITQELLTVKHHFELILESMTEGVLEVTREGRIVYANPTALALIGVPEEHLLGSTFNDVFHDGEGARMRGFLEMKESAPQCLLEDFPLTLNGKQVSLKMLPVKNGLAGFLIILEDVTERKRLEARLIEAQKMEAIGALAGGIAHDFNNALMAIIGNITLAKIQAKTEDKVCAKLDEAERASWKARDLTQQLLPLSKGGKPIKRAVSIPTLLEEVCCAVLSDTNVQCALSLPPDLWMAEIDANQIRQALANLLSNAVQAMPAGGVIEVRAENAVEGSDRVSPSSEAEKYVKISIRDQGGGIPEEHLGHLFEPYFTKGASRGLGLAITHTIISKHGGRIAVESAVGMGTTFRILLPAGATKAPPEADVQGAVNCGKGKVLVMDDEDMVREVAADMLRYLGCSVALARDGSEAIELYKKARQTNEPFDVVILDLTVPNGMGGKETIQELLKIDPQVKAIVSSGYSNDPIMAEYQEHGFCEVLGKPYRMSELSSELCKIMTWEPAAVK
jgi:PAS domain S-box-containing protein